MNLSDQSILLNAKMFSEALEASSISVDTLREYKAFIEENYLIDATNKKYLFMQPLVMAMNTDKAITVESTCDNIKALHEGFDAENYKAQLGWIIDAKKMSYDSFSNMRDLGNPPISENVFFNMVVKRLCLQIYISLKELAGVKEASTSLRSYIVASEGEREKITWVIDDV